MKLNYILNVHIEAIVNLVRLQCFIHNVADLVVILITNSLTYISYYLAICITFITDSVDIAVRNFYLFVIISFHFGS